MQILSLSAQSLFIRRNVFVYICSYKSVVSVNLPMYLYLYLQLQIDYIIPQDMFVSMAS